MGRFQLLHKSKRSGDVNDKQQRIVSPMAIGRRASAFASTAVTQVRAGSGRALSTSAAAQQRTYRDTIPNLALGPSSRVLLLNATGRASTLHAKLSLSLGTNIVGGTSSKSTHPDAELSQKFPLFPDVRTAVRELGGVDAAAVFVPPSAAADAVLECIEEEIPTVVAVAEGIPTRDQMRVMAALHSQSKSRYLGANSPGYTNPRGARLGIAPVAAASPGCIGELSPSLSVFEIYAAAADPKFLIFRHRRSIRYAVVRGHGGHKGSRPGAELLSRSGR